MSTSAKPVNLMKVYRTIKPRKPTLPILNDLVIENGQAMVTDLDIWGIVPAAFPDGVYQPVGKEFVAYPETAGYSLDGAPKIPDMAGALFATVPFPRAALRAALRFAVNNPVRPLWDVICLKVRADRMDIITTDQFALCSYVAASPYGIPEGEYLLPAKAIRAILLDEHSTAMTVSVTKEFVSLSTFDIKVIARRVNTKYYAFDRVIPTELSSVSQFNTKELRKAIKALKPYTCEDDRHVQITLADGGYNLTAKNPAKYLEKTIFVKSTTGPGGRIRSNNIMLVIPKGDPAAPIENSLFLGHRYLEQVASSVSGPHIYMGFPGDFGDLRPVMFSGESLTGGGQA